MIVIYSILSAAFFILYLSSYRFTIDTWEIYSIKSKYDRRLNDNEHRLHHILLAGATSILSCILAILYSSCVVFIVILPQYSGIVPMLLLIKHSFLILFVGVVILYIQHLKNEEDPSSRIFRKR